MSECTTNAGNPIDARLTARLESVSRWSALFVGAVTVVLAELFVAWFPMGDTASALALFPATLAMLYALLTLAAYFERGQR